MSETTGDGLFHWRKLYTFTFSHLADAFIQSDLQMRTIEAIKTNKRANNMQVLWQVWIMDSYFSQKQWCKVKNIIMLDLFQLLSSQDVNWWTGVDYLWIIVMFLSAVWTLILTAPIHCRASIAETLMQCYISPNLMKKQTHLHLGWPEGEHIFS